MCSLARGCRDFGLGRICKPLCSTGQQSLLLACNGPKPTDESWEACFVHTLKCRANACTQLLNVGANAMHGRHHKRALQPQSHAI